MLLRAPRLRGVVLLRRLVGIPLEEDEADDRAEDGADPIALGAERLDDAIVRVAPRNGESLLRTEDVVAAIERVLAPVNGRRVLDLGTGTGANTPNYGVGYATAKSPLGPFTKYQGNPIAHRGDNVLGPGHHCVIAAPDGKLSAESVWKNIRLKAQFNSVAQSLGAAVVRPVP